MKSHENSIKKRSEKKKHKGAEEKKPLQVAIDKQQEWFHNLWSLDTMLDQADHEAPKNIRKGSRSMSF